MVVGCILSLQHQNPINIRPVLLLQHIHHIVGSVVAVPDPTIHLLQTEEQPEFFNRVTVRTVEDELAVSQLRRTHELDHNIPELSHSLILSL